jgi:hypothetical protein
MNLDSVLLKLGGQHSGVFYDKEFNTVATRRVITAILSGELKSQEQVARVIEETAERTN